MQQQQRQRTARIRRQSEIKTKNTRLNVKPSYCCFLVIMTNFNFYSVFRLWAEVFHVSASGAGAVRWQQVSEDLVPVNITCIQDTPECVFHITAYNSQVDKILDVRLVQPGLHSTFDFNFNFQTLNAFLTRWFSSRYSHWTSIGMLCLLERSNDEWYMGSELYLTNRCKTVPWMLCKWNTIITSLGTHQITH